MNDYKLPQEVLSRFEDDQFLALVFKYLDQTISAVENEELQSRLKGDERARDVFVALLIQFQQVKETAKEFGVNLKSLDDLSDTQILNELREDKAEDYDQALKLLSQEENSAPTIEIPKELRPQELIHKVVYPPKEKRKVSKFQIFTFVMSTAAILLLALFVHFAPEKQYSVEVATIVDQMNIQWTDSSINLKSGDRLWTNQKPVSLGKGIIEIKYDDGVDVVVEGPARFAVERSGIYIEYGRLFSSVPESGLGFLVETPTSRFIDLGTEFGIQADVNGSTELHVIKGKVQLFAGADGKARSSHILTENNAARYNANTGKTEDVPVHTEAFVRSIDSTANIIWRGQKAFDLADIVGGGNGLGTGRIQNSINPATGDMTAWDIPGSNERFGVNRYLPVGKSAFIDGIFVPDGGEGPIEVTSSGDRWEAPDTSNLFKYNIVNSLRIPVSLDKYKDYPLDDGISPKEDKILTESAQGNTLLRPLGFMAKNTSMELSDSSVFLHANLGVTFDLNRIREQLPNVRIARFISAFGIGEITSESARLDLYILVDGQQRRYFQSVDTATVLNLNVELNDDDRFLSLVVMEGQDRAFSYDWGLFMNPRLEIE